MKQNVIILVVMFLIGAMVVCMDQSVMTVILTVIVEAWVVIWFDAEKRAAKWEKWYFKELNRDKNESGDKV